MKLLTYSFIILADILVILLTIFLILCAIAMIDYILDYDMKGWLRKHLKTPIGGKLRKDLEDLDRKVREEDNDKY